MTREYLRGEVLLLLDRMREEAPGPEGACAVTRLRAEAETVAVDELPGTVARALAAAESWCWAALAADDTAAFRRRCSVAAGLYDFGLCSGLLPRKQDEP